MPYSADWANTKYLVQQPELSCFLHDITVAKIEKFHVYYRVLNFTHKVFDVLGTFLCL